MLNRLKDVFASLKELLSNEITSFKDKVRIDVRTSTPGLSFQQAWDHRQTMKYQSQPFYVASKSDLIASKRAASRDIDLEDIKLLELPDNPEDNK